MDWKKKLKKLGKWLRKHPIIWLAVLACVLLTVILLAPEPVPTGGDYGDFLDALGMRESSDNYAAVNRFNYMGRYQVGKPALQDAGFMDEDGNWTALANSYGIYSQADFLASPAGQDAAVTAYHTKLCTYIRGYGLDDYIGSTYCGVTVTRSGLLAGCHLVGVGSLKKALASGTHAYDGNNTPAAEYMKKFAGFDISRVWGGEG